MTKGKNKAIKKAVKKTAKTNKGKISKKVLDAKPGLSANTVLAEILTLPGSEDILAKFKVPCLTCPMAKFEMNSLKIGDICKMYGIDCKKLLSELNK